MFDYEVVPYWRCVDEDGTWADVKWCNVCNKIVPVEHTHNLILT